MVRSNDRFVTPRLADADLLVVNKFGKQEGLGRGLCPAIVSAQGRGIPVVVGVNALNLLDFQRFVGGTAREIDPSVAAVWSWLSQSGLTGRLRQA